MLNSSHLRFITDEGIKNRLLDLRGSYKSIQLNEEHVYEDRAIYLYSPLTMNHLELNGLFIADTGFEVEKRDDKEVFFILSNVFYSLNLFYSIV